VFDVLTDHRGYAECTPCAGSSWSGRAIRPNGVGAIRVLHAVGPPLREEVVTYEPPTRFAYRLLSGAPVRDHVGTVTLQPDGDGTRVVYALDTTPKVPLAGGAVMAVVRLSIRRLLKGVVDEAEPRTAAVGGA
jgi:Polyketide cyclase / dehydrase and lipid transport